MDLTYTIESIVQNGGVTLKTLRTFPESPPVKSDDVDSICSIKICQRNLLIRHIAGIAVTDDQGRPSAVIDSLIWQHLTLPYILRKNILSRIKPRLYLIAVLCGHIQFFINQPHLLRQTDILPVRDYSVGIYADEKTYEQKYVFYYLRLYM